MRGAAIFTQFERESRPDTPTEELDAALDKLAQAAPGWAASPIERRVAILERVMQDTASAAEDWVRDACGAKGIPFDSPFAGEEWYPGPAMVIRNARLLRDSLVALSKGERPTPMGTVNQRDDGQTVVGVFPTSPIENVLFAGITGEIWMDPDVNPTNLAAYQAEGYGPWEEPEGGVSLVLGAGNVASIGPMDALNELFVKHRVVMLKLNPVNEYLGPHFEVALAALIEEGVLAIAYGGAAVGAHLSSHAKVDAIHITGSDKTYDAIVFGVGEDGERRKEADEPINTRPITAELSNVSPLIVVPGPWTAADLRFQARHIAGSLVNNAGFNCNATRVIVTHQEWKLRDALLASIGEALTRVPDRDPYYPGAKDRWQRFVDEHPQAQVFGDVGDHCVPWTLIDGLTPHTDDEICFSVEAFNGVMSEVSLEASRDVAEYLRTAVEFCNSKVWGSLNATILIHPASLKDPEVAAALDQAVADLEYGSIGVNVWAALSYALVSTTWGAYPGHARNDIRSGVGTVHNTYLYSRAQKSVIRGPFRARPTPLWHSGHRSAHQVARRLVDFEAAPSWARLPGLVGAALRG